MGIRILVTSLLLCLLGLLGAATGLSAQQGRVTFVPDGDTLHLEDGRKVRLNGIDAPEMAQNRAPEHYFAQESRDYLRRLVQNQVVRLEVDAQGQDRYGRDLATVYLADNRMVNLELVEQGYAFFYPHPHQDKDLQNILMEAQTRAILGRRGFWPRVLAMAQPLTGWVGNRRSKRFHHPDSDHAQEISQRSRVAFFSLEQAFLEGYAPARTSFIWPEADRR